MESLTKLSSSFFENLLKDKSLNDRDIICFQKSLENFTITGKKEDAFNVYFCFAEIFHIFGNGYDNTQNLLELLSDFEYHSGELLMKHRDHYSHSAYVFALGLAIYNNDNVFKNAYNSFYSLEENNYKSFLYHWGLTSLFHDIGYPFQLAHEQVKTYSQKIWGEDNKSIPFVVFGNLNKFLKITPTKNKKLQQVLNTTYDFKNIDDLLAFGLNKRLGYPLQEVSNILKKRVSKPVKFMDHGYFGSVLLCKQILNNNLKDFSYITLDVLTSILLHNNLNKFDLPFSKPIDINEHPLSYMLILCDELQTWDRKAYGLMSKKDPLAWDIGLSIKDNLVEETFFFDSFNISTPGSNELIFNKNVDKINNKKFENSIKKFITSDLIIHAYALEKKKEEVKKDSASNNNFINLCDFAKAIHISYLNNCDSLNIDHINDAFSNLSLEHKISNIEQAKSYSLKLEKINCIYSDKELDYPLVNDFDNNEHNLDTLSREEHIRWVKEKISLGWKYGTSYIDKNTKKEDISLRNKIKEHKLIIPYDMLSAEEKEQNKATIKNMIPLLYNLGHNIRIYRLSSEKKKKLLIGGFGHRDILKEEKPLLKEKIKKILSSYKKEYNVIVETCFAFGADQLISECANELDIPINAVLPLPYEKYIDSIYKDHSSLNVKFTKNDEECMRNLLAQTTNFKVVLDKNHIYVKANEYVFSRCKKFIVLWDEKTLPLEDKNGNPINQGGTYHSLKTLKEKGLKEEDLHIIKCSRA